MQGHPYSLDLKNKATSLRVQGRLSIDEISAKLSVPRGTLAVWLRKDPLTNRERSDRRIKSTKEKREREPKSKYFSYVEGKSITRSQKAKIAEAAVLFRLALHGFNAFTSVFDGDSIDWVVEVPGKNKLLRLEVRWASRYRVGTPIIRLTRSNGRNKTRRFRDGELDYLVGYDLRSDTVYVFRYSELDHLKSMISVREDAAERWDKLRG
jgi:hypothetical protein